MSADVADAAIRYVHVTGDETFERETGVELLVETARLWASLGHHDDGGGFRIDGVTGPDEYSAVADNNVYTNLMAQRNLRGGRRRGRASPRARAVSWAWRTTRWRPGCGPRTRSASPTTRSSACTPSPTRFTRHAEWDFEASQDEYPLLLHYPYFELYRKQVVKQPDLVLAMHLRGDAFDPEQKARNFDYYEQRTVRDSSLSACTQAVMAAEVGYVELAYDYLAEAALVDLDNLNHNTRDGLHIASLAGAWIACVAGLGGMRDHDGSLSFAPRLPQDLSRLSFRLSLAQGRVMVSVDREQATYELSGEGRLELTHHGESFVLEDGSPVTLPVPPAPDREPSRQPPGRAPRRRHGSPAG